jgi:hypothetical protein
MRGWMTSAIAATLPSEGSLFVENVSFCEGFVVVCASIDARHGEGS